MAARNTGSYAIFREISAENLRFLRYVRRGCSVYAASLRVYVGVLQMYAASLRVCVEVSQAYATPLRVYVEVLQMYVTPLRVCVEVLQPYAAIQQMHAVGSKAPANPRAELKVVMGFGRLALDRPRIQSAGQQSLHGS